MSRQELHSCLAETMQCFIELRRLSGTDYESQARLLGYFDRFLVEQGVAEPRITREITDAYQRTLSHLARRTQENRLSVVRQFCESAIRAEAGRDDPALAGLAAVFEPAFPTPAPRDGLPDLPAPVEAVRDCSSQAHRPTHPRSATHLCGSQTARLVPGRTGRQRSASVVSDLHGPCEYPIHSGLFETHRRVDGASRSALPPEKEIQAMLDAVDVNSRTGIRDKALLLLLYNTGARVSEIVGLSVTDLRLDKSPQVQLLGKGRKHRSCPLWPETAQALKAYLQERAPKNQDLQQLFLNANGSGITRFGVRYIIRKYAADAQNACASITSKSVSPHTIRHTTAMHLLRAGNEINMVSYWLGHADINTTHVYVEIDMEMKRKMLQKARAPAVTDTLPWRNPDLLHWLSRLAKTPQLCAAKNQPHVENPRLPRKNQSQLHIIPSFT